MTTDQPSGHPSTPAPFGGSPARRPRHRLLDFHTGPSIVIVVLVAFSLYGSTLHDFFLSDDFDLLIRASREPLGAWLLWFDPGRSGWFRPIPEALWRANFLMGGLDPLAYRTTNLVLHALNGCIVMSIAGRATGSAMGGLVSGLVFVTWPRATAAVSWLSGRYDLTAATFVLMTVYFAMRAARAPRGRETRARVLVVASTVLAIASKEVAVMLPLLLATLASRRLTKRRAIGPLVRPADAAVVTVIITAYLAGRLIAFGGLGGYGVHGTMTLDALMRPVTLLPAFWPSANLVVAPGTIAWTILAAVTLAVLGYAAPVWLAWMLLSLLPAATLINLHVTLFEVDRFFYLASAGWSIGVAEVAWSIARLPGARSAIAAGVFVTAVLLGSVRAVGLRNEAWHHAADLTRRVDTTIRNTRARLHVGDAVDCSALPDNIDGAYAYRNGCDAQVRLVLRGDAVRGIRVVPGVPPDPITAGRDSFTRIWVLSPDGRRLTLREGR